VESVDNRKEVRSDCGESKNNSQTGSRRKKRTASPVVDVPFTYEPVKVPPLRYGPLRGGSADLDSLSVSGPFYSTPVWQNAPYTALLQPKKVERETGLRLWRSPRGQMMFSDTKIFPVQTVQN
jgi:hypothetical protein